MADHLIGFYGGSFNPLHYGHLNVAISVKEACNLKSVVLCPTFESPFGKPLAPAKERLALIQLGIKEIAGLEVSDLEIKRGGISYTIDTLREMGDNIRLIISDDLLDDFHLWKESEAIIKEFSPIVATRVGKKSDGRFEYVKTPIMEISSTNIRERLSKGLPCQHLMPNSKQWQSFFHL